MAHCQQILPYALAAQKAHPLLQLSWIVAVASTETNCSNEKEHGGGGGRGYMQIDEHWHKQWLMLHNDGMDPASNILQGSAILESDIKHFLKKGYSPQRALFAGFAAYNAGVGGAEKGISLHGDPDRFTTNRYASRVLLAATKLSFLDNPPVQLQLLSR